MKNFTLVVLFLSLGLSSVFTSCSDDDSDGMEIVGTWELVSESTRWGITTVVTEVMEFNADRTGAMTTHVKAGASATTSEAYNFKYEFDGSNLTINSVDINQTTKAYVSGGTLTIEAEANGEVYKREFTKLSKEEIEEREEQREKEKETYAILEKLVGDWRYYHSGYNQYDEYDVYEAVLTFKNDMTGNSKTLWTLDDVVQIDEEFSFDYEISGDTITLSVGNQSSDYEMVFNENELTLILLADREHQSTYTKVE